MDKSIQIAQMRRNKSEAHYDVLTGNSHNSIRVLSVRPMTVSIQMRHTGKVVSDQTSKHSKNTTTQRIHADLSPIEASELIEMLQEAIGRCK